MNLWARQLLVDAAAKNRGAVASDAATLQILWDRAGHAADPAGGQRVAAALRTIRAAGKQDIKAAAPRSRPCWTPYRRPVLSTPAALARYVGGGLEAVHTGPAVGHPRRAARRVLVHPRGLPRRARTTGGQPSTQGEATRTGATASHRRLRPDLVRDDLRGDVVEHLDAPGRGAG